MNGIHGLAAQQLLNFLVRRLHRADVAVDVTVDQAEPRLVFVFNQIALVQELIENQAFDSFRGMVIRFFHDLGQVSGALGFILALGTVPNIGFTDDDLFLLVAGEVGEHIRHAAHVGVPVEADDIEIDASLVICQVVEQACMLVADIDDGFHRFVLRFDGVVDRLEALGVDGEPGLVELIDVAAVAALSVDQAGDIHFVEYLDVIDFARIPGGDHPAAIGQGGDVRGLFGGLVSVAVRRWAGIVHHQHHFEAVCLAELDNVIEIFDFIQGGGIVVKPVNAHPKLGRHLDLLFHLALRIGGISLVVAVDPPDKVAALGQLRTGSRCRQGGRAQKGGAESAAKKGFPKSFSHGLSNLSSGSRSQRAPFLFRTRAISP